MDTSVILASLRAERDRIGKAIEVLEALDSRGAAAGRRPAQTFVAPSSSKVTRRRKPLTAAAKKHLSLMMKKRWASVRRGRSDSGRDRWPLGERPLS